MVAVRPANPPGEPEQLMGLGRYYGKVPPASQILLQLRLVTFSTLLDQCLTALSLRRSAGV